MVFWRVVLKTPVPNRSDIKGGCPGGPVRTHLQFRRSNPAAQEWPFFSGSGISQFFYCVKSALHDNEWVVLAGSHGLSQLGVVGIVLTAFD